MEKYLGNGPNGTMASSVWNLAFSSLDITDIPIQCRPSSAGPRVHILCLGLEPKHEDEDEDRRTGVVRISDYFDGWVASTGQSKSSENGTTFREKINAQVLLCW